jgi:DNA replicative helicase MCM subunit Mcm2 (Cdc46/Mcm family)
MEKRGAGDGEGKQAIQNTPNHAIRVQAGCILSRFYLFFILKTIG